MLQFELSKLATTRILHQLMHKTVWLKADDVKHPCAYSFSLIRAGFSSVGYLRLTLNQSQTVTGKCLCCSSLACW